MPKTKMIKGLDDLGRMRIMEVDLTNGEILNSKLLRKSKKDVTDVRDDFTLGQSKPLGKSKKGVGDDFNLGVEF